MQSSDREILLDIQGQLVKIDTRLNVLESRMEHLEQRLDMLEKRFDDLTGYIGNWFTILAIFVAVVGVIAPLIFSRKDSPTTGLSVSDIRELIRLDREAHDSKPE